MAANPCCIRAIPYESSDQPQRKPITVCLYVYTNGKEIKDDLEKVAMETFRDYNIQFVDLKRRPLCENIIPLQPDKKNRGKELAALAKVIQEKLSVFESRLNVTAVQPSYKIKDSKETDTPCVTVFVLGKGKIPLGETSFSEVEKLQVSDSYPFDVVEGYYLPSQAFASSASPLHGGVGIGVEHQHDAGTLGGFLKDEDGKCYILSCEHVLRLQAGGIKVSDVIVQPAEVDFKNEKNRIQDAIKDCSSTLSKQEERLPHIIEESKKKFIEDRYKDTEKNLNNLKEQLEDLENKGKPRQVGKYQCGSKENINWVRTETTTDKLVYVDVAIAKLEEEEMLRIKWQKEEEAKETRCLVYGFKHELEAFKAPTGEIVSESKFSEEYTKECFFTKLGRTTGRTENGQIQSQHFFLNLNGFRKETCSGILTNIPFKKFCKNCNQQTKDNVMKTDHLNDRLCKKCGKEIAAEEESLVTWASNCITLQKVGRPFSEEGDSGSLIFDDKGRAWGIIFGNFIFQNNFVSLAVPIDVAIYSLEKKLGKRLRFWCMEQNGV